MIPTTPTTPKIPTTIDAYLDALRRELGGSDPAMVQDALADLDEFLREERETLRAASAGNPGAPDEPTLVARLLARYGEPAEVAEAYRQNERRVARALAPRALPEVEEEPAAPPAPRSWRERLFGVLRDPHAYGALFYMFLSLGTGIVYFTWAVTGLSLSLGLAILIIGVPFFLLFVASVRGLALMEGRIVETLLGERMPRRVPGGVEGTLLQRVAHWLRDRRTWSTILYQLLMLPLGVLYFTLFAIFLALTLGLFAGPLVGLYFGHGVISADWFQLELPFWVVLPLLWLAAAFDLFVALHLARAIGRLQGRLAKLLLVAR